MIGWGLLFGGRGRRRRMVEAALFGDGSGESFDLIIS